MFINTKRTYSFRSISSKFYQIMATFSIQRPRIENSNQTDIDGPKRNQMVY